MLTTAMQTALEEARKLEKQILESEANLRVLDKIGAPNAMELRNRIAQGKLQLQTMLSAIDEEANRLPD